ncbi:conserved exported hypothetical protein [Paraburkholderia tropica]|uniref:hypothetical protein n=1 Tax=Paraburkholderia tropica TaxID=92647 RepID=UPI001CAFD2E7|nr:hypothetical protein [Paraburkholderia tropica]CAG9202782.1 conserved exported hypothetical protein [Paraburkholderia tropica]
MTRRPLAVSTATAISVVLATIMLAACGPGDNASSAPPQQQSTPNLTANAETNAKNAYASAGNTNAATASSDTLAAAPASYASDPVQSVQASLAADSEQIAPVMSYAPGDEPPQATNANTAGAAATAAPTGNDSSSTVTTSQ